MRKLDLQVWGQGWKWVATPSGRVQVSRSLVNGWEKKAAGDWWIDWCGIAVLKTLYWSEVVKRELSMKVKLLIYIPTLTCGHRLWVVTERMRFRVSAVWLVLWVDLLLLHTELAFDSDASWDPSGWGVLGMSNWEMPWDRPRTGWKAVEGEEDEANMAGFALEHVWWVTFGFVIEIEYFGYFCQCLVVFLPFWVLMPLTLVSLCVCTLIGTCVS